MFLLHPFQFCSKRAANHNSSFDPFLVNLPTLYPLKTPEIGYKIGALAKDGLWLYFRNLFVTHLRQFVGITIVLTCLTSLSVVFVIILFDIYASSHTSALLKVLLLKNMGNAQENICRGFCFL